MLLNGPVYYQNDIPNGQSTASVV